MVRRVLSDQISGLYKEETHVLFISSAVGLAFLIGLMLITGELAAGSLGYLPGVIVSWLEASE